MDFNKKLFSILAIFCIIASAGIVCAADSGNFAGNDNGSLNGEYDQNGYAGMHYSENEQDGYAGSQYYNNAEPGNGLPLENQTNPYAGNATHNATGNATGNATQNATVAGNTTGNATNATSHNMLSTGNPILILLAVGAVLGGVTVLRRK